LEVSAAVEFQKRHTRARRAIRLRLLLAILAAVAFWVPFWINPAAQCSGVSSRCTLSFDDMPRWQLNLIFLSFVALIVAIVGVRSVVRRYYRYPNCNAVPTGSGTSFGGAGGGLRWAISLNPSACQSCGARLR